MYVCCIFNYFQVYNRLSQAIRVSTLGPVLCYKLLILPFIACDLSVAFFEEMLCFAASPCLRPTVCDVGGPEVGNVHLACDVWWSPATASTTAWCAIATVHEDSKHWGPTHVTSCDIMSLSRSAGRERVRSKPSLGWLQSWMPLPWCKLSASQLLVCLPFCLGTISRAN